MNKLPELHVGMRNIKTALSILICLLLYQFVPGNVSYACIAALIAMQSTLEESLEQGRNRIVGTVIGGIFGAAFASLNIASNMPLLRIFSISIGVTILILVCNLIGKRGAIVMGCVTYLVIVLATQQENFWIYALQRVVDNTIGILVAVAVNLTIRPPKPPEEDFGDEAEEAHKTDP
ncbi:FUSC family protein [Oscillospiraceae bacterium PP1C4]